MPEGRHDACWVVDFPLFEWNATTAAGTPCTIRSRRRWATSPSPGAVRSRGYDLVLNGVEIGGGSIRIHAPRCSRRCSTRSASPRRRSAQFGFLLDALRYGAPPHGGIAFGLDRVVAIMAGRESIRDVIAFPKTASGWDPLTGAPRRWTRAAGRARAPETGPPLGSRAQGVRRDALECAPILLRIHPPARR